MYCELIVLFISVLCVQTELNQLCTTPNGEKATCVSYFSCPVIYRAPKNETTLTFARHSRCGLYGKVPLICCGTAYNYVNDTSDYIIGIYDPTASGNKLQPSIINKLNPEQTIVLKELHSEALPDRSECGINPNDDRVYRGERAAINEFPWMVALEFKNKWTGDNEGVRCGGSLISKRFVLTAAHCTQNLDFEITHARLGEWNLTSDPDCSFCKPVQIVNVSEAIPYPFYNRYTKNNDIALLKLERDVEFNEVIRPICLPPENLPPPKLGTKLAVSGWGSTEDGKPRSAVKLKVSVPLVSNERCREALENEFIQVNQMCAGGTDGRDACEGNSGGPLIRSFVDTLRGRVQWYQEGIVSHGIRCGVKGYPGVYTRISRYIIWIVRMMETN